MKKSSSVLIAATLALSAAACSDGIKKTLGLQRNQPDEFAVVERAPLTLPPNYDLNPPQPGAERPQEAAPVNTARGLILRSEPNAPKAVAGLSSSESALLAKAGANTADPNIRTELAKPNTLNDNPNQPVIQKLGISGKTEPGKALNATQEAARLKQTNVKSPQPVGLKLEDKNQKSEN